MIADSENYWGSSDLVFQCLIDKKRVLALKRAIRKSVNKNSVVVDLGTGTGIMAIFAVKAGAKKVYAIEADPSVSRTFEKNLKLNGYKGKIHLIKGDATKIKLPEKVDVVICEMVATGLIDERQIPAMNNILKFCKKKPKIILAKIKSYVELVNTKSSFYGEKLQVIQYEYPWEKNTVSIPLSSKVKYAEVDFSKRNNDNINKKVTFVVKKNGKINGLRITNHTFLYDGSVLRNTDAYCMPLTLPIDDILVEKDEKILVHIKYHMCKGMENLRFSAYKI